ncbi:MAG: STAS domain-containing protein [Phycisphaerales bacterium]|nr:MAG: STAS domain-containing protein [Phycisphaerales bacterium]
MAGEVPLDIQTFKDTTVVNFGATTILDTQLIERMSKELYKLVDDFGRRKLILDFAEVKFLSSSALGMLLNLRKKATAVKGQVVICGMRTDLQKVFKITRIDKLFDFYDSEEKALNAFGIYTSG